MSSAAGKARSRRIARIRRVHERQLELARRGRRPTVEQPDALAELEELAGPDLPLRLGRGA